MTSERREFERISYAVSANYRVFLQKTLRKEELFYGQADIVNISGGGIQVKMSDVSSDLLDDLLKSQKKLILEFTLYIDGKPVKVHGKMAWAHEETNARAGICFVDISASEQKLILDYIEQSLSKNE
ncbi:PilZ domain-containing protein [bacterium]|nr:PilZ domain-containing protein [bacterium]